MTPAACAAILAIYDAEPDDYDPVRIGIEALCMADRNEDREDTAAQEVTIEGAPSCAYP